MIVYPNERYKLLDFTDDYGLVGYYSTLEEVQEVAEAWRDDTDCDCKLVISEWDDEIQSYVPIYVPIEENED